MGEGHAKRGSQLQIQVFVKHRQDCLREAMLKALPSLAELNPQLRWVSPIEEDGFREYQDNAFLQKAEQGKHEQALADFWPKGGPHWDALAIVEPGDPAMPRGVLLVEAKGHPEEMYGGGMKATAHESRLRIQAALAATKRWLGVAPDANWTGPLYQSANRLAHLYFFLERVKVPAWLVNVCFVNDRTHVPTTRAAWKIAVKDIKRDLGLEDIVVPNAADILVEAAGTAVEWSFGRTGERSGQPCNIASPELTAALRAIEPSFSCGNVIHRPCALVLKDGRRLERVLCVEDRRGFHAGKWIHPDEIAEVRESPQRLPARLANKLYEAGESGMGYHIFEVKLKDGNGLVYATGNGLDFLDLPEGVTPGDIADVIPHAGRERGQEGEVRGVAEYEECYYLPSDQ